MKSKIKTTPKLKSNNLRYRPSMNLLAIPAIAIPVVAGIGYGLMKNNKKSYTSSITLNEEQLLKKIIAKEQEANKKLVHHINSCNREVIRLQGLLSKKSSLHKEVLLRNIIKKLVNGG
jgi:hypothetical protein